MATKFTADTSKPLGENEWLMVRGEYYHDDSPYLGAISNEGDYEDITLVVPEIPLADDEVVLNHDLFFDNEFIDAVTSYIATSKREVCFGPFNTRSFILSLKENWRDLCCENTEVF